MQNTDINTPLTKWQLEILAIGNGHYSNEQAKEILNNIIDEIVDNKEFIQSGEFSAVNNILLFTNISMYGIRYGANVLKLASLGIQ